VSGNLLTAPTGGDEYGTCNPVKSVGRPGGSCGDHADGRADPLHLLEVNISGVTAKTKAHSRRTVPMNLTVPGPEPVLTPRDAARPSCNPPAEHMGRARRLTILALLSTVAFVALLDFFIVNVALAAISNDFRGSSLPAVSWVLSAYAIMFATVMVPAGRLADLWGRKKILLSGVAVFTLASLVCGLAPTLAVLLAGRAVQAAGAAMILPTSLGLLYPSFPDRQHTLVVGIWAGVAAVASSSGPTLGGLVVGLSWRWIFLINLPIGFAAFVLGQILLPEVRQLVGSRFPDAMSALSLLAAVASLVLATVQGPQWGWGDTRTVALFAMAVVATGVSIQRTLCASAPIIEKSLFTSRPFTGSTVAALVYFGGFAVFLVGNSLFLENDWHYSPLRSGLAMAPVPLTSIALVAGAGVIAKRFGRTRPAVVGTLLMTVAAAYWIVAVDANANYWTTMLPGMVLMGVSSGLAQAAMFAAPNALPADRASTGSAVVNLSSRVGSAIGVAVLVALTATNESIAGYQHAWTVLAVTGVLAAVALLLGARSTVQSGSLK
jgi:EmrB/QacA subfamily drug resistance transporter